MGLLRHQLEYLMRDHAIRTETRGIQFYLLLQPCNANLEKLVEITADYAKKFQSLQKRVVLVLSLSKHPSIEFNLTELTVEKLVAN